MLERVDALGRAAAPVVVKPMQRDDAARWEVSVRGAKSLAEQLAAHRGEAELYRTLATLCTDVPIPESLDDLRWRGASRERLSAFCRTIELERFVERVPQLLD